MKLSRQPKLLFWIKLVLPSLVLIGLAVTADRLAVFTIRKVDCRLNHYPCPLSLEPVLLSFVGANIFRLDSEAAGRQLINFDPTLTDIAVKKKLPNELIINLERRQPLAAIKAAAAIEFEAITSTASATISAQLTEELHYLDKSGFVYRPAIIIPQPLPEIYWPLSLPLPEGESDLSTNLAKLVNTLAAYYVNFDLLARLAQPPAYVVRTSGGGHALLPVEDDYSSLIASLQFILTNIKMGERIPKKIDLRFDKPVLTY